MELLHAFFQKVPMAALFLAVSIGYRVGRIKFARFIPAAVRQARCRPLFTGRQ